jgi:hypothetical protein
MELNMKIGINDKHFIKQVDNITDTSLKVIDLNEEEFADKDFWTNELLLTYCYEEIIKDGVVIGTKIYPQPKETK